MNTFKFAIAAVAAIVVAGNLSKAKATRLTRVQQTCNQIRENRETERLGNSLPMGSEHYYIVSKLNSCVNTLLTPPYTYLMTSGTGTGLVSRNKEGTQIVLAQFPSSGSTLSAFGLTPSVIKTIAIPNDLQDWPTSALNGCTNLEQITAFGEDIDTPILTVVRTHFEACSNLKHIQIPSSVTIGNGTANSSVGSVFPHTLRSVIFPASTRSIGYCSFFSCTQLISIDLSHCGKLTEFIDLGNFGAFEGCTSVSSLNMAGCKSLPLISRCAFYGCRQLTSLDLLGCTNLQTIGYRVFFGHSGLGGATFVSSIVLPPSLQTIHRGAFAFELASVVSPNLRTIIWRGRSTRPAIVNEDYPTSGISYHAFSDAQTLDDLVNAGTITEIFVP